MVINALYYYYEISSCHSRLGDELLNFNQRLFSVQLSYNEPGLTDGPHQTYGSVQASRVFERTKGDEILLRANSQVNKNETEKKPHLCSHLHNF